MSTRQQSRLATGKAQVPPGSVFHRVSDKLWVITDSECRLVAVALWDRRRGETLSMAGQGQRCSLSALWDGEPPKCGDYLHAERLVKFAYRLTHAPRHRPTGRLVLHVEKVCLPLPTPLPTGTTVHLWRWTAGKWQGRNLSRSGT